MSMLIVTTPWGPLIVRVTLDTQETEQYVLVKMITLFLDRSSSIYFSYIAQINGPVGSFSLEIKTN